MSYNVLFYALSAEQFAQQLKQAPEKLLRQAQRRVQQKLKPAPEARAAILAAAGAICRGEVPRKPPQPYFEAFHALVSSFGEEIALGCLQELRHAFLLDLAAIRGWTQEETPPFAMPRWRKQDELPQFGFMSAEYMREVTLPGLALVPPVPDDQPWSDWCRLARNQFREVVESVSADNLDLVGYFSA